MRWGAVILAGALGVLLLLFGGNLEEKKEKGTEAVMAVPNDVEAYGREVEERVKELCSTVAGAGESRVAVTLGGGYEALYAVNSQSNSTGSRKEFVMSGSGSSEEPLLLGYTTPSVAGIGIVCEGGGDPLVRKTLVELVSATLGISSSKIYVAPLRK